MGSFSRKMNRKAQKAADRHADDVTANAVAWAMGDVELTRRTREASRRLGLPPMQLVTLLVAPDMKAFVAGSGIALEKEVPSLNATVSVPVPLAALANAPWAGPELKNEVGAEYKRGMRAKPAHQTMIAYLSATDSLAAYIELARLNEVAEGFEELGAVDHIGAGGS